MASLEQLFEGIGLNSVKAKEISNNKKLSPILEKVIKEATSVTPTIPKQMGNLLYSLATTAPPTIHNHLPFITKHIATSNINSSEQLNAAISFFKSLNNTDFNEQDFIQSCGIGVTITPDQIKEHIIQLINSNHNDILQKRYAILSSLLSTAKSNLKWANTLLIKQEIESQLSSILGPKDAPQNKPKKEKAPKETAAPPPSINDLASSFKFVFEGELSKLHKPGQNPQINSDLMKEHLQRTGGKVITRFPPEPNGFLHIGHAKAININFGYAAAHNGITYLRYDDTNPEAELDIYFTAIKDTVEWLGFSPHAITYSSDHFQRLYDLAVELIKKDKAYVCHCTGEQIHAHRGGDAKGPRSECSHRNKPIQESLEEFQKMKQGRYAEGEAILRMKMDMQHPSPQFWDLVAYRVLYTPHHRTGSDWCIYPTYDYTHCICDSFEDITHSLCTTEFTLSRESYYWLIDALEIYKPVQWEYGRLNITHTVLSKRKLNKLVTDGHVLGWDDPRLFTLAAVRRRGFTPQAINAFVRDMGVTTANTVIPVERLENYVRDHLNQTAPRFFIILDPIKVTLTNLPPNFLELISIPNMPRGISPSSTTTKNPIPESRTVPFTNTIYIDRSDFRESDDPNFYRLSINKSVGLLNVQYPIHATRVIRNDAGDVVELEAVYEHSDYYKPAADAESDKATGKPKTFIQWVGESKEHASPVPVTARLVSHLFKHPNPASTVDVPDGWLSDLNPDSLTVCDNAMMDVGVKWLNVEDKFQGVRVGYFCVDKDTEGDKIVLNRTVTLKEDNKKDK